MKEINRKWLLSRTLLIAFILLTPLIQVCLIKGADRYKLGSYFEDKYSYIGRKIYTEKRPVDFLFIGPSQSRDSINARLIQDSIGFKFKKKDVSVENFGHDETGIETDYLMMKDLVEQRGVKVIFLGVGGKFQKQIHRASRFLWNPFEDNFEMGTKLSNDLYAEKILDSSQFLAKYFFTRITYTDKGQWDYTLGSSLVYAGYNEDDSRLNENLPYKPLKPEPKFHKLPELTLTSSSENINSRGTYNDFQLVFLRKIVDLTRRNNIKLYFLHYPTLALGYDVTKVDVLWFPERVEDVTYLGIPESVLYGTESRNEMKKYFWNSNHTNANGNMQYTLSIMPALMEIYESTIR